MRSSGAILAPANVAFRNDLDTFARRIALHGAANSLARLVVKVCAPGVPDSYQGAELWHLRMVDPDNRAPVDFDARLHLLNDLSEAFERDHSRLLRELARRWTDGRLKLFATWRALCLRRDHSESFATGAYVPLHATGRHRHNVLAFARCLAPGGSSRASPGCRRRSSETASPSAMPGRTHA